MSQVPIARRYIRTFRRTDNSAEKDRRRGATLAAHLTQHRCRPATLKAQTPCPKSKSKSRVPRKNRRKTVPEAKPYARGARSSWAGSARASSVCSSFRELVGERHSAHKFLDEGRYPTEDDFSMRAAYFQSAYYVHARCETRTPCPSSSDASPEAYQGRYGGALNGMCRECGGLMNGGAGN